MNGMKIVRCGEIVRKKEKGEWHQMNRKKGKNKKQEAENISRVLTDNNHQEKNKKVIIIRFQKFSQFF